MMLKMAVMAAIHGRHTERGDACRPRRGGGDCIRGNDHLHGDNNNDAHADPHQSTTEVSQQETRISPAGLIIPSYPTKGGYRWGRGRVIVPITP